MPRRRFCVMIVAGALLLGACTHDTPADESSDGPTPDAPCPPGDQHVSFLAILGPLERWVVVSAEEAGHEDRAEIEDLMLEQGYEQEPVLLELTAVEPLATGSGDDVDVGALASIDAGTHARLGDADRLVLSLVPAFIAGRPPGTQNTPPLWVTGAAAALQTDGSLDFADPCDPSQATEPLASFAAERAQSARAILGEIVADPGGETQAAFIDHQAGPRPPTWSERPPDSRALSDMPGELRQQLERELVGVDMEPTLLSRELNVCTYSSVSWNSCRLTNASDDLAFSLEAHHMPGEGFTVVVMDGLGYDSPRLAELVVEPSQLPLRTPIRLTEPDGRPTLTLG